MGIWEFDQELHDKTLLEDGMIIGREQGVGIGREQGIGIGREQGIELGGLVYRKIQAGETDNKKIAGTVGCSVEEVEMVRKQFGI